MKNEYFKDLSPEEESCINGGFLQFVVAAIAGGLIYDALCHPGETIRSIKRGGDAADAYWS